MGALAPVCPWIPEDDLLLKNAVEAGASLESLAKGAVLFSRRFTVTELLNRWHALLYDPVVSAKASVHMIEIEHSASSLPSKPYRFEDSKESNCASGKRKADTVRNCYYSMRKRVCNEPFNSTDLNFVVGNRDEPSPADCMLGDPISNHCGVQDSNVDMTHRAFPEFGTGTVDACYGGIHNPIEENLPMAHNNMHTRIPCTFEENVHLPMSCSVVEESDQAKEGPVSNRFEALAAKPLVISDQSMSNTENGCSGIGGSQVFDSPILDCGALLHNSGCTSPLPPVPIWRTSEGVSVPTIPDVHPSATEHDIADKFEFPKHGNMEKPNNSAYEFNQMPLDDEMNSTAHPNDYLAELSNALLNFTDEEELLFMNADGNNGIEESYMDGFSSLLLDSPNGNVPNIAATEAALIPDNCRMISGGEHCGESDDKEKSHYGDGLAVCSSESQRMPCASAVNPKCSSASQRLPRASLRNPQFPELCDGVICCLLNTEDPEIPSNDDVFLPYRMPSPSLSPVSQLGFHEANNPTSLFVKGFSDHQKANAGCLFQIKREHKVPENPHLFPQMVGSQLLPGQTHLDGRRRVKFHLPKYDRPNSAFRYESTACQDPSKISANESSTPPMPAIPTGEAIDVEWAKHLKDNADCYLGKPAISYPQANAISSKQEADGLATSPNQQALHAELSCVEMTVSELIVNHSPEDQNELHSDFDSDIPHFSDVEAMILDMDLSPDDQNIYSRREVSRRRFEDSKRAIIRLEQAAHSHMQREIASHGAFAVLYGRRSKFYIKKSEVLLGRAAPNFDVDIDLAREGQANKISRRQAIIKMEQSGSFHLKNLGKCSIYVNDKEITTKQTIRLTSSCLIEVRGMSFVFETNQACVKQYTDGITDRCQTQDQKV